MGISFYPYVCSDETRWDWPEMVRARLERELVPAYDTPEYFQWMDGELEPPPNPLYDRRLDLHMTELNAKFVLNELGMFNGDLYGASPIPIDQFELGLRATIARNPDPIPGLEAGDTRGALGCREITFGTRDGYANECFARLLSLVEAAREYGATHVGWG